MKVEFNFNYPLPYKSKHGSVYDLHKRNMCADLCDDSRKVNSEHYSGSFTGKEKAAAKFSDRLLKNLIDGCNNHTVIIQNLWALGLAILPRPIAIMLLPDPKRKNNKDKMAAACHGIASGLVGFGFASAIMYPLGVASKKIKDGDAKIIQERFAKITNEMAQAGTITKEELLKDTKIVGEKFLEPFGEFRDGKLVKLNKALNFDRMSKALDMAPDTFVFGIAKAMLTIALIPPIMKYLFGEGKQQKTEPAKVEGGQK